MPFCLSAQHKEWEELEKEINKRAYNLIYGTVRYLNVPVKDLKLMYNNDSVYTDVFGFYKIKVPINDTVSTLISFDADFLFEHEIKYGSCNDIEIPVDTTKILMLDPRISDINDHKAKYLIHVIFKSGKTLIAYPDEIKSWLRQQDLKEK